MAVRRKKRGKSSKRKKKISIKRLRRRFTRIFRNLLVLLLIIVFGTFIYLHKNEEKNQRIVITSNEYNGIDVSKYQGRIDWQKVANNEKIQFVYIKATEGASSVDKKYEINIKEARKVGLKVGSYHFFTIYKTPEEQFANFRKYVHKDEQDLLPMVDVEETGNRKANRDLLQRNLSKFMELVKSEYGKYPLLYSQYGFYNEKLAPEFN